MVNQIDDCLSNDTDNECNKLQSNRLITLINNLNEALLYIDDDNKIELYNASALYLLNTNTNISGSNIDDLFKLIDEKGSSVKLSAIRSGVKVTSSRNDLRLDCYGGELVNIHLSIVPVRHQFHQGNSKKDDGYLVIATDITKQKSLDDQRDEFISVVSHELRTPVAIAEGALSNVQLLIEKGGDPSKLAKTLDEAHKQILYLGQMVNDLSTLSRAQRGIYMDNDDINIDDFISSIYDKYKPESDQKGLRLVANIDVSGLVRVPSMVIEEIMQNFIVNAISYTEQGVVEIGVRSDPQNSDHVEFYVKDSGVGISRSDIDHIFERFWRSEDYRTRKTKGTGLGLYVVSELAKRLHTDVKVDSTINVGSTFSISLPLVNDRS